MARCARVGFSLEEQRNDVDFVCVFNCMQHGSARRVAKISLLKRGVWHLQTPISLPPPRVRS